MAERALTRGWIDGLCTWRAALMLGGLLTHGTLGFESMPGMALLASLSHAFRMGVFFVIAGFLSSHSLLRRSSDKRWLIDRLNQIGVPSIFGILALSPLMSLLIYANPETQADPRLWDWYHFWFLIALMLYTVLGFGAHQLDGHHGIFTRLDHLIDRGSGWQMRLLVIVASLTALLMTVTSHAVARFAPPDCALSAMQWRLIVGYAPLFLLGFAMSRSASLLSEITGSTRLPIAVLVMIGTAYVLWYLLISQLPVIVDPAAIEIPLTNFGAAFCPPAAAALIIRSSLSIRQVPPIVNNVSDASFTMYVLHLPFIYAARAALGLVAWGPWVEFWVAITVSGCASYAFHRKVVRRSALASLLLNGRYRVKGTFAGRFTTADRTALS
ncbi:hypothetical protein GGR39_003392 [Novosphingobium fluoreni]|uniref:Acyltransferase 3 domain-containing protein n=1 Tax=Novosphingobium fluoreni TaxID=1391222 RepID=A0A7W6C8V5_9SPHN|nr:hypothetical protein [Novosphingobium fluoreni]